MQSKSIGTSPGFPAPPVNSRSRISAGQPAHPAPPVAAESPEKPPVVPGHANLALGATDPFAGIQDANEGAKRFGSFGDFSRPFNPSQGNPFAQPGINPANPLFPADDGFKPRDETKVGSGDGQKPVDRNPFTNGEAAVQQQPVNPLDNPFDGAPLVNPAAGKGLNEQAAPQTNHGIQPGVQPAGPAPADADPAAPAPQAKTGTGHKTVDQVDAERQAVEALDNAVFFKSMQARLAKLCGEHGIDLKDVEPLVNLFKDAAATSLIQMAEASEKATGQKLKVDDPLFFGAMKLSHTADPLDGDHASEEGDESTFDPRHDPGSVKTSQQQIEESIEQFPSKEKPGIKRAAVKASDLLASRSNEHGSLIDLGLTAPRRLDANESSDESGDETASELPENDPLPATRPPRTTNTAELRRRFAEEASDLQNSSASSPGLVKKERPPASTQ